MDVELDAAESRRDELETLTLSAGKETDENDQVRKILKNRRDTDSKKLEVLEKELKEHTDLINDLEAKYEEYSSAST